jgi:hypothetical protein
MAMAALVPAEKRDTASGSIPLMISISIAFSGPILRSCKQQTRFPIFFFLLVLFTCVVLHVLFFLQLELFKGCTLPFNQ